MIVRPLIHSKNTFLKLKAINNVEYPDFDNEIDINRPGIAVKNVVKSLSFHASEDSQEILEFNILSKYIADQHSIITSTAGSNEIIMKESKIKKHIVSDSNPSEVHKQPMDPQVTNRIELINTEKILTNINNYLSDEESTNKEQKNIFECIVDFSNPKQVSFFNIDRKSQSDTKIPVKEIVIAGVVAYICIP
ncbi:hypothetical protein TVAG_425630 [Trichomonas vaginalis G3]|uniref:Uncharacterized protein n=1 Tax=Trichomonas vaginalis (strain ATCC PRA-98 / G3) TaxID=412133 RepID=A2FI96_TRIV3|nr:hypothetical protein TVAGG3_0723420 [Trichomonas vaginalis G3]EAX95378.1 hypothetical protein TVAG_425630 [Trichomonas vaginalis G3]KAI5510746.1 hypothetical protein TVAGG3_0723420 [Trichomonas vaginalis G3]|eukprot:XP_001308308.1 hypothetical protein [Trichomonas vaginalis G3]